MTNVWIIIKVWQLKYTWMNPKDSIFFMFRYVIDVEMNWSQKKFLVQRKHILKEKQHILSGTNTDGIPKEQRGLKDELRICPNKRVSHPLFLSGQPWVVMGVALRLLSFKRIEQGRISKYLTVLTQVTIELKCIKFSIYF